MMGRLPEMKHQSRQRVGEIVLPISPSFRSSAGTSHGLNTIGSQPAREPGRTHSLAFLVQGRAGQGEWIVLAHGGLGWHMENNQ